MSQAMPVIKPGHVLKPCLFLALFGSAAPAIESPVTGFKRTSRLRPPTCLTQNRHWKRARAGADAIKRFQLTCKTTCDLSNYPAG